MIPRAAAETPANFFDDTPATGGVIDAGPVFAAAPLHEDAIAHRNLFGFLWRQRARFAPGLGYALGRIVVIAPLPLLFKHIIDRQLPAKDAAGIGWVCLATVVLLVFHQWFSVKGSILLAQESSAAIWQLRGLILNKIQFLSFGYLDQQRTGHLLSKYVFDTQKVDAVIMPILNSFLPDAVYCLLTFAILIWMNWQLSVVLLLMMPVIAWMRARYFARFGRMHEISRLAQEKLTGKASELFTALRLVRSYGQEEHASGQLHRSNREVARARVELTDISSSFNSFSFASVKLLTLLVVAGGAWLAIYGHVSTGAVLAFVVGVPSLVSPIQMYAQLSDQYFIGQEAYRSIKTLLDAPYVEGWSGAQRAETLGRIEFDAVSFSYAGKDRPALSDFTLTMAPGEKIALVGPSGAGKSTVANLILGLYKPDRGTIRIDGVAQENLDMKSLRQNCAIVMQESLLLSGTVEENIRFAKPGASDEEVRLAARRANAEPFILRMERGYRSLIGERGATLSGGQRQRLSIARAFLRNPALLILDEPTSALDYQSEGLIQEAIDTLSQGRTVITIAHRLSTIRQADRIVVLDEGRCVEVGSFNDLSARGGYFARLLAAQHLSRADAEPPPTPATI